MSAKEQLLRDEEAYQAAVSGEHPGEAARLEVLEGMLAPTYRRLLLSLERATRETDLEQAVEEYRRLVLASTTVPGLATLALMPVWHYKPEGPVVQALFDAAIGLRPSVPTPKPRGRPPGAQTAPRLGPQRRERVAERAPTEEPARAEGMPLGPARRVMFE